MSFSSCVLEALPVELIDEVCSYLEAEDLLNLSALNIYWRNAVNRNFIWKRLCVKYFNLSPFEKPIIEHKCHVEPAFEIVTNSSLNLSDVCSWRIRYAQEIHVINNWIQQRYHVDETKRTVAVDKPLSFQFNYGHIWGNSLLFTYSEKHLKRNIEKYAIKDLCNDIISYNEVVNINRLSYFRNGFVVEFVDYFSYYAFKEDVFELKIRTVFTKALHPEIPLLADISFLQNYEENFEENELISSGDYNERYCILTYDSGSAVVWDFKNLNTFSFDVCDFLDSSQGVPEDYHPRLGERESSYFFLYGQTTDFIFNIQNSTVVLLHKLNLTIYSFWGFKFFHDSLALLEDDKVRFFESNGIIREIDCSVLDDCTRIINLINCRSFYCGLAENEYSYTNCLFLIDKKSLSVKVIKRYNFEVTLKCYLEWSRLDFVIVNPDYGRSELHDLKKLNVIKLDDGFNTEGFDSNKIICCKKRVLHFW